MDLGTYLRGLREAAAKKIVDVSADLGIPKPTLYMWEGPRSRPDPVDIRRLLVSYGVGEDAIAEALRLRSLLKEDAHHEGLAGEAA